ncbi:hypothetical protein FEM48_Zijuj09G0041800 [Ziziphus jujuba var. spinosa]|uniref:Cupin type-1 domain-containing protein n=1 Tax=Ziziphus jujuba var. spinosa TaxID=714518 RepID=A0A978UQT9_ZIZJJ|nr:hypothetical protein FEM48_Zijuj09G0041800 [Ziziphus jujuba var. spinosa]
MALKSKLCLLVVLLSVVALNGAFAKEDPELKQCKHQCRQQQGFDDKQKQNCERDCEEYLKQKEEIERQKEKEREEHERGGGGEGWEFYTRNESQEGEGEDQQQQQEEEDEEEENPYVFEEEHFDTWVGTREGRVEVLPKFTKRSNLLRGIENYRVGFLEANPNTFVSPSHFDADIVLFVVQGKATVTIMKKEKKESHNLKRGYILKVPAGHPFYLTSTDENENLFIVKLFRPIFLSGHYEAFYGPGGQDPESFYTAFSWDLLEAAFKTDRNRLKRLFRQQKLGSIMKVSKEQVQGLSKRGEGGSGIWPFGSESGSFNLFRKRPSKANKYGHLHEVDSKDYEELQNLNLMISYANITRGAMTAPLYNSRATKIAFVIDGEGCFEMACPHLSSGSSSEQYGHGQGSRSSMQKQKKSKRYQRVSGRLTRGVVFIVPAGHPYSLVASPSNNLEVVCFEVDSEGNIKYPLAGDENIVKQMDGIAKELAFNVPNKEVDRIFGNQEHNFFLPGPTQQKQGGRAYA